MTNRREFLKYSASLPMMGVVGSAFAQTGAIQFGCAVPLSGTFAANGKFADMGMKLAIEKYGKLLGRSVAYSAIDTEGKPATAIRRVQEAIQQNNTRFFLGGFLSSEALAIGKEVDKAGGVCITTAGADELTGVECNRSTFRWSVPTFGAIEQTVRPIIAAMPKAKRWYTITPQYVFGEGLLSAAKAVFKEKGIEHVGNSYHSLAEKEFSGYLINAMAAKPDVLLLLNFSTQSSDTLRQAISFGMKQKMTIVMAWASGLEQFQALGADLCEDVYFGAQYWHGIDTPFNKAFVKLTNASLNQDPNYSLAGSYICTKIVLDAIARANSVEPKAVIAALEGAKFDSLTGSEEIRREDHQVIKNYYLLKGKAKSKMRNANDYADIISSGKSFLPIDKTQCNMA
jgi:branched-chain amino acid transport system substrate-binding protein